MSHQLTLYEGSDEEPYLEEQYSFKTLSIMNILSLSCSMIFFWKWLATESKKTEVITVNTRIVTFYKVTQPLLLVALILEFGSIGWPRSIHLLLVLTHWTNIGWTQAVACKYSESYRTFLTRNIFYTLKAATFCCVLLTWIQSSRSRFQYWQYVFVNNTLALYLGEIGAIFFGAPIIVLFIKGWRKIVFSIFAVAVLFVAYVVIGWEKGFFMLYVPGTALVLETCRNIGTGKVV